MSVATSTPESPSLWSGSRAVSRLAALFAAGALVWSYSPILMLFVRRWENDPQYSHGFLVPFMAIGVVWLRGIPEEQRVLRPSWSGLPVLIAALGLRFWARHYYFEWLEWISLIPATTGVLLLVTGPRILRHTWPAVALLTCMIPLPYRAEVAVLQPLQSLATSISTFVLQTIGFAAREEGHVVWIGETPIGIAQACSGLRMLTGFFALAFSVVVVTPLAAWKRILLIASAAPVALICNAIRITGTGTVFALTGSHDWQKVSHDWLGWAMPALALGLLLAEMRLIEALLVEETVTEQMSECDNQTSGSSLHTVDKKQASINPRAAQK